MDHQQLLTLRFPEKLWYIVNSNEPQFGFMKWGSTGKSILINVSALHKYLLSEESILRVDNFGNLVIELEIYGFKKINNIGYYLLDALTNSYEFSHENFDRDKQENLQLIKRKRLPLSLLELATRYKRIDALENKLIINYSQANDPCTRKVTEPMGFSSSANMQLAVEINMLKDTLRQQVEAMTQANNQNPDVTISINVPAKYSDNEICKLPKINEIPGFYGDASPDKLKTFFGKYLPIYANEAVQLVTVEGEDLMNYNYMEAINIEEPQYVTDNGLAFINYDELHVSDELLQKYYQEQSGAVLVHQDQYDETAPSIQEQFNQKPEYQDIAEVANQPEYVQFYEHDTEAVYQDDYNTELIYMEQQQLESLPGQEEQSGTEFPMELSNDSQGNLSYDLKNSMNVLYHKDFFQ